LTSKIKTLKRGLFKKIKLVTNVESKNVDDKYTNVFKPNE